MQSIKPNADKGGIKFGAVGEDKEDDVEDQLTTDAWAALPNRAELEGNFLKKRRRRMVAFPEFHSSLQSRIASAIILQPLELFCAWSI